MKAVNEQAKIYRVTKTKGDKTYCQEGTLLELIDVYGYTLSIGGDVNRNPKTIKALIKNLQRAVDNAAANGYSGVSFSFEQIG